MASNGRKLKWLSQQNSEEFSLIWKLYTICEYLAGSEEAAFWKSTIALGICEALVEELRTKQNKSKYVYRFFFLRFA
jgi:hypothetical protein